MKYTKILAILLVVALLLVGLACGGSYLYLKDHDGIFARDVSAEEEALRLKLISTAKIWLGTQEGTPAHQRILAIYNAHEPLAQGYVVKPEDNWCATYVSAMAITCNLTDIIPTECGCERQVELWKTLGRWEENEEHLPLPGDFIYYAWVEKPKAGDCVGWSDHVGIVVGTAGPFIKVIEGNKDDQVTYRIVYRHNREIRGYGLPDYASKVQ